jgi:hypothetical protein
VDHAAYERCRKQSASKWMTEMQGLFEIAGIVVMTLLSFSLALLLEWLLLAAVVRAMAAGQPLARAEVTVRRSPVDARRR